MKQCITVDEQIALLKNHGVSFDLMSEGLRQRPERSYIRAPISSKSSPTNATTPASKQIVLTPTLDSTSATSSSCHISILP